MATTNTQNYYCNGIESLRNAISEGIIRNVKSIYEKLYGEQDIDEDAIVMEMSDATKEDVSIMLYDEWQDCYNKVILTSIVVSDDETYFIGYNEVSGAEVEDIFFDSIGTDDLAKVADVIYNKNYTL